ncbi:MAG TPA: sulfatase-like hydrolase/transferase [Kofleriaceae bacterium]|nr:sulfatase-like hydrolase/transferase [Kofleriaceae bacterium]
MDHGIAAKAVLGLSRATFLARRALARRFASPTVTGGEPSATARSGARRRNILFVTVDQQRYDALGVTGNRFARTPALDGLARAGVQFRRAHVQNVVCMPSRTTMLTGQHPLTHGVVANGISAPHDGPNVAALLAAAGYHTALLGKAHFDPHLDPLLRFRENRLAAEGSTGPWRGFAHVELATHGPLGGHHYADWLWTHHRDEVRGFGAVLSGSGGGETGAPEVRHNPIPREHYHTDWIADRAIAWLRGLAPEDPFFCWVSFPDPHHPFDPPASEVRRRAPDFRDRPLPPGHPGSAAEVRRRLAEKPRHWLDWYDGRYHNPEGGPIAFRPAAFTDDQLREVDAMIQVENELIDDAVARILAALRERGVDEHTDVFYTSDHGDLQGDHGLLFKGPYHVTSLLHVPFFWRPAPSAHVAPSLVDEPVGHVDLAPTFLAIAGLPVPPEMQGAALPTANGQQDRERVLTTFDSQFAAVGMHLRTIYRDGFLCTTYLPTTRGVGGRFRVYESVWLAGQALPRFDGTEGELYDLRDDPHQARNLWNERRVLRDDLIIDLRAHLPPARRRPLRVAAPT